MKYFTRLCTLVLLGVTITSLIGCGGQQESKTIQQGDAAPSMGKTAPAPTTGAAGTAAKPKLMTTPPP